LQLSNKRPAQKLPETGILKQVSTFFDLIVECSAKTWTCDERLIQTIFWNKNILSLIN